MQLPIKRLLLAAMLIEAANFWLLAPPIDVGYEPGTPWYIQILGLEWVILHWSALFSLDWVKRLSGCHLRNLPNSCSNVDRLTLLVGGYLETVFLLLCLVLGLRLLSRLRQGFVARRAAQP